MPELKKVKNPTQAASRLCSVVRLLNQMWNRSGSVKPDLISDYEAVQAWIWIPNLYQCVEQMFKLMIQEKSENSEYLRTHHLGSLFQSLSDHHRDSLRTCFASFLEIYSQITVSTLDEFLTLVDRGENGRSGYVSWRYFPLEGFPQHQNQIPVQSVEAMFEIARMCSEILRTEVIHKEDPRPLTTLSCQIERKLHDAIILAMNHICIPQKDVQEKLNSQASETFDAIEQSVRSLVQYNLLYLLLYLRDDDQSHTMYEENDRLAPLLATMSDQNRLLISHIAKSLAADRHIFVRHFSNLLSSVSEL